MKKLFKETKPLAYVIVVIISFVSNGIFLYLLDTLGYFSWVFKCYGKTLELIMSIQNVTFAKYLKVMLTDVAVIISGLIILFAIFDWIPNGVIDVLGYKNVKSAKKKIII